MIYLIIFIVLVLLIGPNIWVQLTIKKYAKEIGDLPGNGHEFAQHLIDRFKISDVKVEITEADQDHYDPADKCVRLSPANFNGKSISAIAIAAHEVGHAIQFHHKEAIVRVKEKYTPIAIMIEKIAIGLLSICPILMVIFKVPQIGLITAFAAVVSILISVLLQLIILPMEWDASFNKALPILEKGEFLSKKDIPAARKILKAAAMTYVAATLSSILNVWRWIRILKR